MILFVLGLLIGGCVGMLMTALCVAAKKEQKIIYHDHWEIHE